MDNEIMISRFAADLSQIGYILPICFVIFMVMLGMNKIAERLKWTWLQKSSKYIAYVAWGSAALVILGAFVFISIVIFTVFKR